MIRVAFLWHLHQPDYRDPLAPMGPTGTPEPAMPWVRTHALRGYRDMALESVEQSTPWTLNVVPSLLDQLEHYASGGTDPHQRLTAVAADALDPDQHATIRRTFVAGHPAMQQAHPAWRSLAAQLEGGGPLTTADWRDVQVWSTLQWFGATARRDYPVLQDLWARGRGFDETDKQAMLAVQESILIDTPRWWRAVQRAHGPALSASAYHHPILPLLVDLSHAKRALPDLPLDTDYRWPGDAQQQLVHGRQRVAELAGDAPSGLWPSEGSVSPEILPLVAQAGFRWLCSDVHVLQRSARGGESPPVDDAGPSGPWDLGHGLVGWFRDTELSDHIGFRCAGRPPAEAAGSFVELLLARHRSGTVLVALDGENPWETFADAGQAFRRELLDQLERAGVGLITLDEASEASSIGRVETLHSGSWIGADYSVWIGDAEDRLAWKLLSDARTAVHGAGPEAEAQARDHLHAAAGSDWFWWFGARFSSAFDNEFDRLFRAHLEAAYRSAGLPIPAALHQPVNRPRPPSVTPPFGWLPELPWGLAERAVAGRIAVPEGSMASGHQGLVRFGWTGPEGRVVVELEGEGLQLEVDGCPVAEGAATVEGPSIQVLVRRNGQPVWPGPVHLVRPKADAWWGP